MIMNIKPRYFFLSVLLAFGFLSAGAAAGTAGQLQKGDVLHFEIRLEDKLSGNYYIKIKEWGENKELESWCEGEQIQDLPFFAGFSEDGKPLIKKVSFSSKKLDVNRLEVLDASGKHSLETFEPMKASGKDEIIVKRSFSSGDKSQFVIRDLVRILTLEALLLRELAGESLTDETLFWLETKRAKRMAVKAQGEETVQIENRSAASRKFSIFQVSAATKREIPMFTIYHNSKGFPLVLQTASGKWSLALKSIGKRGVKELKIAQILNTTDPSRNKSILNWLSTTRRLPRVDREPNSREIEKGKITRRILPIKVIDLYMVGDDELKRVVAEVLYNKLTGHYPRYKSDLAKIKFANPQGLKKGFTYSISVADIKKSIEQTKKTTTKKTPASEGFWNCVSSYKTTIEVYPKVDEEPPLYKDKLMSCDEVDQYFNSERWEPPCTTLAKRFGFQKEVAKRKYAFDVTKDGTAWSWKNVQFKCTLCENRKLDEKYLSTVAYDLMRDKFLMAAEPKNNRSPLVFDKKAQTFTLKLTADEIRARLCIKAESNGFWCTEGKTWKYGKTYNIWLEYNEIVDLFDNIIGKEISSCQLIEIDTDETVRYSCFIPRLRTDDLWK